MGASGVQLVLAGHRPVGSVGPVGSPAGCPVMPGPGGRSGGGWLAYATVGGRGRRRGCTAAVAAGGPLGVDGVLPLAEAPAVQAAQEVRDAVGGDADQSRPKHGEQVRGFLRGPAGRGDGVLVGEDVGDPVGVGVQEMVLGTAGGGDPPEVRRQVGFDEAAEPFDFLGVGVAGDVRPAAADPQPGVQVVVGEEVAGVVDTDPGAAERAGGRARRSSPSPSRAARPGRRPGWPDAGRGRPATGRCRCGRSRPGHRSRRPGRCCRCGRREAGRPRPAGSSSTRRSLSSRGSGSAAASDAAHRPAVMQAEPSSYRFSPWRGRRWRPGARRGRRARRDGRMRAVRPGSPGRKRETAPTPAPGKASGVGAVWVGWVGVARRLGAVESVIARCRAGDG